MIFLKLILMSKWVLEAIQQIAVPFDRADRKRQIHNHQTEHGEWDDHNTELIVSYCHRSCICIKKELILILYANSKK